MTRGFAVVLTLLLLGFALYAGWFATRRTEYFPRDLQAAFETCDYGNGAGENKPLMWEADAEIYAEELAAFHEPSLFRRPGQGHGQSVRFLWVTEFDSPLVVRIDTLADGRLRMIAKTRPGGTGSGSGVKRKADMTRTLTPSESATLSRLIAQSGIQQARSSGCSGGWASWIVEFTDPVTGYRYRAGTYPKPSPIDGLAAFMSGLPGWELSRAPTREPLPTVPPASP